MASHGGAIFTWTRNTVYITGGEIHHNAVYSADDYESGIGGNGVIFGTENTSINISGGKIYENKSGQGTIHIWAGTFRMSGGEIYNNNVDYGGGILLNNSKPSYISGGTIRNNTAKGGGGAIHMFGSTLYLTSCTITDNTAPNGNLAYVNGGKLVIKDQCTLQGAIYNANGGTYTYVASLADQDKVMSTDSARPRVFNRVVLLLASRIKNIFRNMLKLPVWLRFAWFIH